MSTKNFVPRVDGEGSIGRPAKRWEKGYFVDISAPASGITYIPAGGLTSQDVQSGLTELATTRVTSVNPHFSGTATGLTADMITSTPGGSVSATTVQTALTEIATEKVQIPLNIAQGDTLYRGALDFERLAAGTTGQILRTNGAGLNPSWATPSSLSGGVQGSFKNLRIVVASNTQITFSADQITVYDASNNVQNMFLLSTTIDKTVVGVNGLDTGVIGNSMWYSVWAIAKPDGTKAGLLSLSLGSPLLPAGYTFMARMGWVKTYTDGTLIRTIQTGRTAQYVVALGVPNSLALPTILSGVQGVIATPTYIVTPVVGYTIPVTASIFMSMVYAATAATSCILAPNASYGALNSLTNPPRQVTNITVPIIMQHNIVVESANVYYSSNGAANLLQCLGWEDNI